MIPGFTGEMEIADLAEWSKKRDGGCPPWGQSTFTLTPLVWAGPWPKGYPKNPEGALVFDGGPFDSHQATLDKFAAQADALIAWRERNKSEKTR